MMTKSDLCVAVATALGVSNTKGAEAVNAVLDQISDTVAKGKAVNISGFGKFEPVQSKARIGRNPKTGQEIPIPPRVMIKFRPGKNLKESAN